MQYHGTVKWFDPDKAFGFISSDTEGDIFVHQRNLAPGRDELIDGQQVTFMVRPTPKGSEAYDVEVTGESSSPPRRRKTPSGETRNPRRELGFFGTLPKGPITCRVTSMDREGRFLFVRSEREDFEIFVHNSLYHAYSHGLGVGVRVRVTVEQSNKGLRATSFELA